jgi:TRAP-type C4-dicarboxylate transport system permease large subunit
VASVLVTACSIAKADLWEVTKVNLPFIGVLLLVLLLITYVPSIAMWPVNLIYR